MKLQVLRHSVNLHILPEHRRRRKEVLYAASLLVQLLDGLNLLFKLHPSVLEPDFDLPLSQTKLEVNVTTLVKTLFPLLHAANKLERLFHPILIIA